MLQAANLVYSGILWFGGIPRETYYIVSESKSD